MGLLLWVRQSIQVELDKYHKVNTYTYLAGLQHYNIKNCSKQSVAQPLWCKVTDQSLRGSHRWASWMAQEEGERLSKERLGWFPNWYDIWWYNIYINISSTWRCFTRTSLTSPSVPNLELWPTSSLSSLIVRYWQPNKSLFLFVFFGVGHCAHFKATHDASHYYASYDLLKLPIKYSF